MIVPVLNISTKKSSLAQLAARSAVNRQVAGSIPAGGEVIFCLFWLWNLSTWVLSFRLCFLLEVVSSNKKFACYITTISNGFIKELQSNIVLMILFWDTWVHEDRDKIDVICWNLYFASMENSFYWCSHHAVLRPNVGSGGCFEWSMDGNLASMMRHYSGCSGFLVLENWGGRWMKHTHIHFD